MVTKQQCETLIKSPHTTDAEKKRLKRAIDALTKAGQRVDKTCKSIKAKADARASKAAKKAARILRGPTRRRRKQ